MSKQRDTYKYQFKVGNKIVHGGITNDLERREAEHQAKWPRGHITQVGRKTTEEAARKWEDDKGYSQPSIATLPPHATQTDAESGSVFKSSDTPNSRAEIDDGSELYRVVIVNVIGAGGTCCELPQRETTILIVASTE